MPYMWACATENPPKLGWGGPKLNGIGSLGTNLPSFLIRRSKLDEKSLVASAVRRHDMRIVLINNYVYAILSPIRP